MAPITLILVRLLPDPPTDGVTFQRYLTGLSITAYDKNILNTSDTVPTGAQDVLLGTAALVAPVVALVDGLDIVSNADGSQSLATPILQHIRPDQPSNFLKAVATAVIVVDIQPPSVAANYLEYPTSVSYDIRLELSRNGIPLPAPPIEWNANCFQVDLLSPNPFDYMGIQAIPPITPSYTDIFYPSVYTTIPDNPSPAPSVTAGLLLDTSGLPPNFKDLLKAVNSVLGVYQLSIGTTLQTLTAPLTQSQCDDIASEIAYDNTALQLPTPVPNYDPTGSNNPILEDMYTRTKPDQTKDQARQQFEGNLTSYHAKLDAVAQKLSKYIYAASAAIQLETLSSQAYQAVLTFPAPSTLNKPNSTISVLLTSWDPSGPSSQSPLNPSFAVPAAFFYALGYQLSSSMQLQRRQQTILSDTLTTITQKLQAALNNGILNSLETSVALQTAVTLNVTQAARCLSALIAMVIPSALPEVQLTGSVNTVVTNWLDWPLDDSSYWTPILFDSSIFLDLMLQVVSGSNQTLFGIIQSAQLVPVPPPPATAKSYKTIAFASELPLVPSDKWQSLFTNATNPAPLPDATKPGDTATRAQAFVTNIQKIFTVNYTSPSTPTNPGVTVPSFYVDNATDILLQFFAGASNFDLGAIWSDSGVQTLLSNIFKHDSVTQSWALHCLKRIWTVFQTTNTLGASFDVTMRYSYMEALYARGFVSADSVAAISQDQFATALTGTIIDPGDVGTLYKAATALPNDLVSPGPEPGYIFKPANAGSLVNCVPPSHLSPLGPIEYLYEMLSTVSGSTTLDDAISARRGNVNILAVTIENLRTSLPQIDLVLESLEMLGDGSDTTGAIYDTTKHPLATLMFNYGQEEEGIDNLFAAVPEHSSPALHLDKPSVYSQLRNCFTAPGLPYAQGLDVNRTYLSCLRTTRFDTMRHFRREITEFALDPSQDPAGFQPQMWRLPIRFDIALEYLHISEEEYTFLYSGEITAQQIAGIYGISKDDTWESTILNLAAFLKATGLTYCELLELQRCGYFVFTIENTTSETDSDTLAERGGGQSPPECPPCCLSSWALNFDDRANTRLLYKLIVFIRLWQKVNAVHCEKMPFSRLADICTVLQLFNADDIVNDDFIREFVALLMLHDRFCFPWTDKANPTGAPGVSRTKILAIWGGLSHTTPDWKWAINALLHCVRDHARERFHCASHRTGLKITAENLDPLAELAGFSTTNPWSKTPVCTIRFVEVLTKVYASEFTVGEILFIFTNRKHLDGDDPLPLGNEEGIKDKPLNLPEDEECNLDSLRCKLLAPDLDAVEVESFGWHQIESIIRDMGYVSAPANSSLPDPLMYLAEHFFPGTLRDAGQHVSIDRQRFSVRLVETSPKIWATQPCYPFHYTGETGQNTDDQKSGELWFHLPLRDEDVLRKLRSIRQLTAAESQAVSDLYFQPRAALAPFALLFSNFEHAMDKLIQEPEEVKRFAFFRREVLLFRQRCNLIAAHLAEHVGAATMEANCDKHCPDVDLAKRVLKSLIADENIATTPWEDDSGRPPTTFTWDPHFSSNALAALLGLVGTGLLGTYKSHSGVHWAELRGGLAAFGPERNRWNVPVPTLIPALQLKPSLAQGAFGTLRNGLLFRDVDSEDLAGAESFECSWGGSLLIQQDGCYEFFAGRPRPGSERPSFEGCDEIDYWLLTLTRGETELVILNHRWGGEKASDHASRPVRLRKGTYDITVKFKQANPDYKEDLDIVRESTGLQIKYHGPDTEDCIREVPFCNLFINSKSGPLDSDLRLTVPSATDFLKLHYVSSLRDIRRTYQRAFKALLFAHRFCLSAKEIHCDNESELGFMLDHADLFEGTSFYQAGQPVTFKPHLAWFDFNFLPVFDPYFPPDKAVDSRVNPSLQRKAAMFDWWERIFDYVHLRQAVDEVSKRPVWLLFEEVIMQNPPNADNLIRHLKIDLKLPRLVLDYFAEAGNIYTVSPDDLTNEIWTIRLWHARSWVVSVWRSFFCESLNKARPALWASSDPSIVIGSGPSSSSGNVDLVEFVQESLLGPKDAPKRLKDLQRLNDGLRERARHALISYLCGMDRVTLPSWSPNKFATEPRDLTNLLLQDVEVGMSEKSSRVSDIINSVQTFVQRARIGLESSFKVTREFSQQWERQFATFNTWLAFKRRYLYGENWVAWDQVHALEKVEGFCFAQKQLLQDASTIARKGSQKWWPSTATVPTSPGLELVQSEDMANLNLQQGSTPEGLALMATPQRDARPSLLAAGLLLNPTSGGNTKTGRPSGGSTKETSGGSSGTSTGPHITAAASTRSAPIPVITPAPPPTAADQLVATAEVTMGQIPLWIEAAIRLGVSFVRVAAAGPAPAFPYAHEGGEKNCCENCHCSHLPVMDEYYFWLQPSSIFDPTDVQKQQNADLGASSPVDPTTDWESADQIPGLLVWDSHPLTHLFWTRVRSGRLDPPRRSDDGIRVDKLTESLYLNFCGRNVDSLVFTVIDESLSDTTPGFRYDMPTDSAVVIPQVAAASYNSLPPVLPTSFAAFPFFAFYEPGAPLAPVTPFGLSLVVAKTLKSNCEYEAALKWCSIAFNPLDRDNTWAQCPAQVERSDHATSFSRALHGSVPSIAVSSATRSTTSNEAVLTPLASPDSKAQHSSSPPSFTRGQNRDLPCCPTSSDMPPILRSRAVFLEYLHILLHWADRLLSENSSEASQKALVLLDVMDRLLGSRPVTVEAQDWNPGTITLGQFSPSPPALNPRLLKLYDEVADRRTLIHSSENCARQRNSCLSKDVAAWGSHRRWDGEQLVASCSSVCCSSSRCQPYRYAVVFPKAMELTSQAKNLGSALLSAYEKGDAEYLAAMRATQDRNLLDLGLDISKNQWRAADWDVQALGESLDGALTRLRYYNGLIATGNNTGESSYETSTQSAMESQAAANVSDATAEAFHIIPDLAFGVAGEGPYQSTSIPIGTKMAESTAMAGKILNTIASISSSSAGLSLTQGGWTRRLQEWQNQVDVISYEIQQIKRQKIAAERRRHIALKELNNHQQQMEHAAEVQDFMRDKFTKHELDLFLQQETATLYRRMFDLAFQTAREAEEAFRFERGEKHRDFLAEPFWDSLHEGLLAGDKLELALHSLDHAFMETNCREYELNRRISLACETPLAMHHLRTYGYCEVELPEYLFDRDHPGHYLRRIKSVSISIASVAGPYTSINCNLQLLSSVIRMQPLLPGPELCCCDKKRDACAYNQKNDPYVVRRYGATEAIATSHAQDDAGLFELNFRDERYLPFELQGAVSRWRVELPRETNYFDFTTMSDVVLNMNYTAREGGAELRKRAAACAAKHLPGNGLRLFDVRHEFPDVWPLFEGWVGDYDSHADWDGAEHGRHVRPEGHAKDCRCKACQERSGHGASHHRRRDGDHGTDCRCQECRTQEHRHGDGHGKYLGHHDDHPRPHPHSNPPYQQHDSHFSFPLRFHRGMFPYLPSQRALLITRLWLFLTPLQPVCDGTHIRLLYSPPGKKHCRDDDKEIPCVVGGEYPGVFEGVVDVKLPVGGFERRAPGRGKGEPLGEIWIPKTVGRVREAWLLAEFQEVRDEDECACEVDCVGRKGKGRYEFD